MTEKNTSNKSKKLVFLATAFLICTSIGYIWHKAIETEKDHKEHVRQICMHSKPTHPIHPVKDVKVHELMFACIVGQVMDGVPGQTMVA